MLLCNTVIFNTVIFNTNKLIAREKNLKNFFIH